MPSHVDEPQNRLTAALTPPIEQPIEIWDTTLRDGEQTPGVAFSIDEKVALAKALDELGVTGISAGIPVVSAHEREALRRIVALGLRCHVGAGARLVRGDVDAIIETGAKWLGCFTSLSDWHMNEKLKASEEDLLAKVRDVIPYAVKQGINVSFAIEDATRAPIDRLHRFIRAGEEAGAIAIRIADTVGILTPSSTERFVEILRPLVKGKLIMHLHNDLGLATANAIAAFEAGADGADVTVAGLGERAGNTPLEELAVVLKIKYGRDVGIKLDRLMDVTKMACRFAGQEVAQNKPVVGDFVFAHESGIHVAGLLANPVTYEPYPPAIVSRKHEIIFGKHSGLGGLRHLLQQHGIKLSQDDENAVLARIKSEGQQKAKVKEESILAWARACPSAQR